MWVGLFRCSHIAQQLGGSSSIRLHATAARFLMRRYLRRSAPADLGDDAILMASAGDCLFHLDLLPALGSLH